MYRKKQQSELTVITRANELCSCIITVVMQKDCAVRTSVFSSLRENSGEPPKPPKSVQARIFGHYFFK